MLARFGSSPSSVDDGPSLLGCVYWRVVIDILEGRIAFIFRVK